VEENKDQAPAVTEAQLFKNEIESINYFSMSAKKRLTTSELHPKTETALQELDCLLQSSLQQLQSTLPET